MSTNLKPTKTMSLTQFCGPFRSDDKSRLKLQMTQRCAPNMGQSDVFQLVTVDRDEALELATALLQWVQDEREEDLS